MVKSQFFDTVIMALIVGNTLTLALEHDEMSVSAEKNYEIVNIVFSVLFILEALLKIVFLGWYQYIDNNFN